MPYQAGAFGALRHRNFQLYVGGQIVSLVGTFMQAMAQSWLIYRLTKSEWLLGIAWFCLQAPVFFLAPLGGLAADRYSRHRIVVVTQTLLMLQALALAALTLSGRVRVEHVLALALLLGTVNAFDMPGRQSLVIQMTGKDDLLSAISLNSAVFNAARVVGPSVAGFVVARAGEGLCFLFNGLSFVAVIAALLAMRLPRFVPRAVSSPFEHLVDGFRYALRNAPIRTLLLMVGAVTIAYTPALVLMPFYADQIFHRGARGLGLLMGAMGVGAVTGTLFLARRGRPAGLTGVMFLSAVILGAGFVLVAYSPSFYLAMALMPFIGFATMRSNASANTLIQTLVRDEYRGRIMALYTITVVGIAPFASLATGAIAGRIGVRPTVMIGGLIALLASAWFRLRTRRLGSELI